MPPSLANRFEMCEDRFTGEPEGLLCFGAGKLHVAERYASERGVSLECCAFYTDAYADLPLLEVVGHPFVVCLDPQLRREAERRGWSVLWWSEGLQERAYRLYPSLRFHLVMKCKAQAL